MKAFPLCRRDSDADDLTMLLPTRTQFIPIDSDEEDVLGESGELREESKPTIIGAVDVWSVFVFAFG